MVIKVDIYGDFTEFLLWYSDIFNPEIYVDSTPFINYDAGTFSFTVQPKDYINLVSVEYIDQNDRVVNVPIIDNKAIFDMYIQYESQSITIVTENAVPDRNVSGFNKLYLVDNKILYSVAGERFNVSGIDLGEYILNLLEIPFKLDSSIQGIQNTISLGQYKLQTVATEINSDMVIIDLGTINVPEKFQNSFDYMNTTVKLHLPYTNSIDLDVHYVIGSTIKITYLLDLYSGDCTVNIHSSKVNQIIRSESIKIGRDIPFIRRIGGNVTNQLSTFNGVNNNITTPFIEVMRNKLLSGEFNNHVTVNDTLSNVSGFVEVSNIILNTEATTNEKDEIISLLRNGVYIK